MTWKERMKKVKTVAVEPFYRQLCMQGVENCKSLSSGPKNLALAVSLNWCNPDRVSVGFFLFLHKFLLKYKKNNTYFDCMCAKSQSKHQTLERF